MPTAVLRQFDVAGPRYTSYPTADRFAEAFGPDDYAAALRERRDAGASAPPLSLYVHIPFCESLCYYCACNKVVTRHHERATQYLAYLARETRLQAALVPILGSEIRNELGKQQFVALLSPERQGVMENVRASLDRVAAQSGARIIDVRIKKADLPDGTPLQSAFDRMRTAREQEARSIRAEGAKRAQIIRADADAEAARVYANSFGKDVDFYEFYRAMQSYQITFLGDGNEPPAGTNIILSPQNDYLKEFTGRGR